MLDTQTLEDRLIATGFRTSGFDYLRIVLATLVLLLNIANTVSMAKGLTIKCGMAPFRLLTVIVAASATTHDEASASAAGKLAGVRVAAWRLFRTSDMGLL